jgi:hypothetical protein
MGAIRVDLARLLASLGFLLLAAAHLVWPRQLDNTAIILFGLAALPWLIPFLRTNLRSMEALGLKLEFVEKQLSDQSKVLDDHSEMLRIIVAFSMSGFIYGHLQRLYFAIRGADL